MKLSLCWSLKSRREHTKADMTETCPLVSPKSSWSTLKDADSTQHNLLDKRGDRSADHVNNVTSVQLKHETCLFAYTAGSESHVLTGVCTESGSPVIT